MLGLHLTDAEHKALLATLVVSHRKQIDVEIKNRDEDTISSLTAPANRVIGGAVQVDSNAPIARTLDSLTIVDPAEKLRFEADTPAHGAVYADRFVAVSYGVYVPDTVTTWEGETLAGIGDWVPIPVFWGPVGKYSRSGVEVQIMGQGKEVRGLDPAVVHEGFTLHKGQKVTDAIKEVARRHGETRFDIPELTHKLDRPRLVERGAEWWKTIAGEKNIPNFKRRIPVFDPPLHGAVGYRLEPASGLVQGLPGHRAAQYNARGQLAVRKLRRQPGYVFRWGRDFTTRPSLDFDGGATRNFVRVYGAKLKNGKRVEGHAQLQPSHPMSPEKMARNGDPLYLEFTTTREHLTTQEQCRKEAQDILFRIAAQVIDLQFDCFPIPMLEEDDWVAAQTPAWGQIQIQAKQFTIPLSSSDSMSIGRNKKVKLSKRRHGGGGRAGPPGGRGGRGGHRRHGGKHGGGKHRHGHKHGRR